LKIDYNNSCRLGREDGNNLKRQDPVFFPAGIFLFLCYNNLSGLGRGWLDPLARGRRRCIPQPVFLF